MKPFIIAIIQNLTILIYVCIRHRKLILKVRCILMVRSEGREV